MSPALSAFSTDTFYDPLRSAGTDVLIILRTSASPVYPTTPRYAACIDFESVPQDKPSKEVWAC